VFRILAISGGASQPSRERATTALSMSPRDPAARPPCFTISPLRAAQDLRSKAERPQIVGACLCPLEAVWLMA
jgi:hypothetical protein